MLIPCDRRDDILWHTPLSWLNGNRDAWLDMKQRFDVPTPSWSATAPVPDPATLWHAYTR
ncbi:MAG: hypothetical protein OSJ31_07745 [Alistipes sp.]|nr:hypothetical protein [Alistipes sp.]